MNDRDQIIALAKALAGSGWTWHHGGLYISITNCVHRDLMNRLLNPLESESAMRVAVMELRKTRRNFLFKYLGNLYGIVDTEGGMMANFEDDWKLNTASARQMAEAALRAIDEWKVDNESTEPIPRRNP